jgi:hypothetical protein
MPDCNDVLRLLPVLKGIPAACLLALLLAGPLDLAGLAHTTGYRGERVRQALTTLEMLGLASAEQGAWKALLTIAPGATAPGGQDSRKDSLESKTLVKDLTDSDSLTDSTRTQRILAAAQDLFGEPVLLPSGADIDPQILLAVVAEAYDNRHRLRKPARVCAVNMQNARWPGRRYLDEPASHLPRSFLRQAGLSAEGDEPDESEADTSGLNKTLYAWPAGVQSDGNPAELAPEPPGAAQRLWQEARQELQLTMPKALYENNVRPLQALDFDPEQGTLFLQAGSAQACAWLEERLKRTLERLLVGIHGESVQVVFLAPEEHAGQDGGGA